MSGREEQNSMLRDLARPFPPKYIHGNPSGGGTYVKHHVVEQRLIQVLGIPPQFRKVEVFRGYVAPIAPNPNGRSQRAKDGSPALIDVVVGVIAQMAVRLGDELVLVEEAGDCEEPHNWKTDGARLKDAMSDAYKRCAMRLGCGLHLWSQDEYFLYDKLSLEEAEGTPEVIPPSPSTGTSRPGAAPAPSAPPTTHLNTAETQVMDRVQLSAEELTAKQLVHKLVSEYGDERVGTAAKRLAVGQNRRVPKDFKSLESWAVADLMLLAQELAEPERPGVAGSVSGTDAGADLPPPGTPSPEELLDLIDRAKEAGLIGFSDIAKHSAVFLKADSTPPATWGQLASAPPEALAELVSVLDLRERVDPKQGSLT